MRGARCGDTATLIPDDAEAIAFSLTVISPDKGFFTVFACSAGLPETSNINARTVAPTANLVVVSPDADGDVCVFSSAGGDVIIDVAGWFAPGPNRFAPIDPVRAADTRQPAPGAKLAANTERQIEVAGSSVPGDAVAVAINVAAVQAEAAGFMVAYPCGGALPLASNLNFVAGENRAASAIVEVGANGRICVQSNVTTHFIADVTGYYAPSSSFGPSVGLRSVADTRVVDTRSPARAGIRFAAGTTQTFDLKPFLNLPDETVATALNVVAVRADAGGFVTVYPCGEDRPTTSSLNYDLGQTANLIVAKLSDAGEVCVYTSTAVDLAIDLFGSFAGPEGFLANQVSLSDPASGDFVFPEQDYDGGADYTFRCDDSGVPLDLRFGVAPGVSASVNGTATGPGDVDFSISGPDGYSVVELTRGERTQAFSFRCLPPDFPKFTTERQGQPADGWSMTNLGLVEPTTGRFVVIFDERFVPVWFKRTPGVLLDFKLLSDGTLVGGTLGLAGFGTDPNAGHRVFNLDGSLLEIRRTVPSRLPRPNYENVYPTDFHEYEEIPSASGPSGRAVITYPLIRNQDLSNTEPLPFQRDFTDSESVVGGVIEEFDGNDNLTFLWDAMDHFSYDEVRFPARSNGYPAEQEVDVFHLNSVDRVEEPGCEPLCDYVVSARHLDAVFRIDRATSNVEWVLGSIDPSVPNKGGAQRLEIIDDPFDGPLRQHDARLDGNRLTLFDNRTNTNEPARFVEYEIDEAAGTATMIRQILQPEGETSLFQGSARVAPDGSILVNYAGTQPMFVEYDADGNEIQRLMLDPTADPTLPFIDASYRIVKYGPDAFEAAELRRTSGGFVQ